MENVLINGNGQCMDTDYEITVMEPSLLLPKPGSRHSQGSCCFTGGEGRWSGHNTQPWHRQPQAPGVFGTTCQTYVGTQIPHLVAHAVTLGFSLPYRAPPPGGFDVSVYYECTVMEPHPPPSLHAWPMPQLGWWPFNKR